MTKKKQSEKSKQEIAEFNFINKKSNQLGELESLSDDDIEHGEDKADLMVFND